MPDISADPDRLIDIGGSSSRALIGGLHSDIQSFVLGRCRVGLPSAVRPLVGVYALSTEDEAPNPDHARLKLITNEDRFQRYKILNPETVASK